MALVQRDQKKEVEVIDGVFTVYSVDAADRFSVLELKDGTPTFHQVMLAFIQAPKVGRRQGTGELSPDDPCGFDAMELVRGMVIGRQVHFRGAFYVDPLKRFAGQMILQDGTDVSVALLSAGLATIATRIPDKMPKALHDEYLQLQSAAKAAKKGLYAPGAKENRIREVLPHPPEPEFGEAITGKNMKVRVDRVASGTGLLIHVGNPSDDLEFQAVQATMTGIQCPHMFQKDGTVDPHGQAAKAHTERLLLHRNITVRFDGVDANGNYMITITGGKGTFQEELLTRGLASVNPASINKLQEKEKLQAAEKSAQGNNLGLWGNGTAADTPAGGASAAPAAAVVVVTSGPIAKPADGAEGASANAPAKPLPTYNGAAAFDGTVVQVINGDTIVVRNGVTRECTKVSLAGVKAPKITNRDGEQRNGPRPPESRVSHEGYTWEAREFLRTTFIGQRVKVRVEYARVMDGDAKEIRAMATVIDADSGTNVGAALLRSGYAKFFLGRNDVCSCAEELRVAEATAIEAKRGLHNPAVQAPSIKMTELNRIGEKQGKHYLSFFQRGMQGKRPPNMTAIVEQVMSGSSFRVYVPREHCIFTLRLAGVVTPSNFGESNDPFAEESKDFAVVSLQQREVEIQVEAVDKGGNFIGYLYMRGKNFAVTILSEGLATASNPERCLNPTELAQAEAAAKAAKKNIWSDKGAVPVMAQKRAAQQAARYAVKATYTKAKGEWFPVYVTNVDDSVYAHIVPATEAAEATRATLAPLIAAIGSDTSVKRHAPTKGETVVAFFKEDGQWYRGKVVELYPAEKRADVLFLDYGNVQDVPFKDLRQIPSDSANDVLRTTDGLAQPIRLAYVKNREDTDEFLDAVVAAAWDYIGSPNEVLQACVEYTSDGGNTKYYTIATKPGAASLQEKLLQLGLGLVERRTVTVDPAEVTKHLKQQDYARSKHLGMWIHGDFDDDDEDE